MPSAASAVVVLLPLVFENFVFRTNEEIDTFFCAAAVCEKVVRRENITRCRNIRIGVFSILSSVSYFGSDRQTGQPSQVRYVSCY